MTLCGIISLRNSLCCSQSAESSHENVALLWTSCNVRGRGGGGQHHVFNVALLRVCVCGGGVAQNMHGVHRL